MKVIAYFICILGSSLVFTILGGTSKIGALPSVIIYGIFLWLANLWCKGIDEDRKRKADNQKSQQEQRAFVDEKVTQAADHTVHNEVVDNAFKSNAPEMKISDKESEEVAALEETVEITENNINSSSVKYCRKCGFELLEGSLFCSRCGCKVLIAEE